MGIGGAAVYSLALMVLRALERLGAHISRLLGWVWQCLVDGAALHGADLYASPAAPRRPWNETEERKDPPRR
jgi:hypothetical protein